MSLIIERARSRKRVTWVTITGIILLPVLIGGVLIGALWNPTDRLDNITAAIVNDDEPVTINGQLAPLGRQLAAGLVEGSDDLESNVHWVISNTDDAAKGLKDGTYQAAITIPSTFSSNATSTAGDDPQQATIDLRTAPDAKVFDDVITGQIASIAAATMGESLSQVYVENVLEGFTTLNDQLGGAADGADELADGAKSAADGTASLADGATQLADGAAQSATGAQSLADGTSELSSGANGVSGGASLLSDGLGQLTPGAQQLAGGTSALAARTPALVDGVQQLSTGLSQLNSGLNAYVGGLEQFENAVRDPSSVPGAEPLVPAALTGNAADAASGSASVAVGLAGSDPNTPGGLVAQLGGLAAQCDPSVSGAALCDGLAAATRSAADIATQAGATAVSAGTASAYADGLAQQLPTTIADQIHGIRVGDGSANNPGLAGIAASLADAGANITDPKEGLLVGVTALDAGVQQLSTGAGQLSSGLDRTTSGASDLADGAYQLATGTEALADGASQLASGSSQLASGTSDLATGAGELSGGMTTLSDGTKSLADGLTAAVEKIPAYTDAQRTSIAKVVSNPVTTGDGATSMSFGGAAIPLLVILALWFGGLGSYVAIQAVSRRSLASRAPSILLTLKSFVPGAVIGAVQGLLLSVIVQFATKYAFGEWLAFAGLAVLAGVVFAAVNQALVAVFGGTGRWIAAIGGVLFFATGVVSTTPGRLAGIADVFPTAPAFRSLLTVVTSASGAGGAITALVVWLLAGIVTTTLVVARRRSTDAKSLQTAG